MSVANLFTHGYKIYDDVYINHLVVGQVNSASDPADVNASIEVKANLPVLFSRMTTSDIYALSATDGMQVYNTSSDEFLFHESGIWTTFKQNFVSGDVFFAKSTFQQQVDSDAQPILGQGIDFAIIDGLDSSDITQDDTGQFTFVTSGVYRCTFSANYTFPTSAQGSGLVQLNIFKTSNANLITNQIFSTPIGPISGTAYGTLSIDGCVNAQPGDTVFVGITQNSGASFIFPSGNIYVLIQKIQ